MKKIVRGVVLLGVLALAGISAYYFQKYVRSAPQFYVRTVRVEGLIRLTKEAVVTQSGIVSGANLFELDLDNVSERVEAMPYVNRCTPVATFPDTVTLTITEREPVATVMLKSHAYEIDADRVILRRYAPTELPLSPYFTNIGGLEFIELGDQLEQPALLSAFALWNAFSSTGMSKQVDLSEIAAYSPDDLAMFIDAIPYRLRWGRGNFEDQAHRLDILWKDQGGTLNCNEYLDLRFDGDLVCK